MKCVKMICISFMVFLIYGCGMHDVEPDESMFELAVTLPEKIYANQPADVLVDIRNHSKYTWEIRHGLDLFHYEVKDQLGNSVPPFIGMRVVDSLGHITKFEKKSTYSFYKSDIYQKNLNQITIQHPGTYTLEVSANLTIRHQKKNYPLIIKADPIEFIVR